MKRVIVNVLKILIIVLIIAWICIIFVDYFKARDGQDPVFCIKEEVKTYSDGTVYSCVGLGYKAFRYERKSISAVEFGPFFIEERQS